MKAFGFATSRRNAVIWTALLLALFAVAMVIAINRFAPSDAGHTYMHLTLGTPMVLLAAWLWPPRGSRIGRVARAGFIAGLLILGGGQLLESMDGGQTVHNIAFPLIGLGTMSLALAGLSTLLLMATRLVTRLRRPQEGGTSYQDVRGT